MSALNSEQNKEKNIHSFDFVDIKLQIVLCIFVAKRICTLFCCEKNLRTSSKKFFAHWNCHSKSSDFLGLWQGYGRVVEVMTGSRWRYMFVLRQIPSTNHTVVSFLIRAPVVTTAYTALAPLLTHKHFFFSSVRSSYSHPDLLVIHPPQPTFSDHTGPQHWTFTFWANRAI